MKNIGIIGLGYVGLTLAVVCSAKGYNVFGVEIDSNIKKNLSENKAHFFEPGIDCLINEHNKKSFHLVDKFEDDMNIEAFIVTVGTPLIENTKEPNYEYLKTAINSISNLYTGKELILLRSTVSVGTTRKVVLPLLAQLSGKPENDLLVAFCPERTIEGKAINELQELPQIIGTNNEIAMVMASEFFEKITPTLVKVDSLEAAELVKLFNNTYRDISFAIGNIFNFIAQSFNIDGTKIIEDANYGYVRSNIPMPGFVGGPCLEKDPYILTYCMDHSEENEFIINAREYNKSLEDKVVDWVKKMSMKDKKITISGLAFKGEPNTSDLRGSSAVGIAKKLKTAGYNLALHDFYAKKNELEDLNLGLVYDELHDAMQKTSILLILNNNSKYSTLILEELIDNKELPIKILDVWNVLDHKYIEENKEIEIYNIGNIEMGV